MRQKQTFFITSLDLKNKTHGQSTILAACDSVLVSLRVCLACKNIRIGVGIEINCNTMRK